MRCLSILGVIMKFIAKLACATAAFLFCAHASYASEQTLIGVTGSGGLTNSIAYVIDPATGDAVELGQLTYNGSNLTSISSFASHPTDGFVYMVNNTDWSDDDAGKSLFKISASALLSGNTEVEFVTDLSGRDLGATPDAAFRSDGKFYVWSENSDDLVLIDISTGDVTWIESEINSWATGIDFDAEGKMWVKTGDVLHSMDINAEGTDSSSESRNYATLEDVDFASNMLSLGSDGYFWTGYRTIWGEPNSGDTVMYKFLPTPGDITVDIIATISGIRLSALEWVSGSAGKDTSFWKSVESCRLNMAGALSAGSDVSVSTYQSCFFTGVNASNVAAVNAALKALVSKAVSSATPLSHAELMQSASMMADRLDLAQRLSTGKLVYAAEFKNLGLNISTSTLDRLKSLPSAEVDTWEEIEAAASKR